MPQYKAELVDHIIWSPLEQDAASNLLFKNIPTKNAYQIINV